MADELCQTLAEAGLVCTCIRIESETEHGEQLSRLWRHHRAFTPAAVADRVRWQLDGWLAQRASCRCPTPCPDPASCPDQGGGTSGGLTLVRLVPEEVTEDDGRQLGFWGGASAADERAGRGLARLQGLLGPGAVLTAVVGGGRGPAEQVRFVPWGDPREPAHPLARPPDGPPEGPPDGPPKGPPEGPPDGPPKGPQASSPEGPPKGPPEGPPGYDEPAPGAPAPPQPARQASHSSRYPAAHRRPKPVGD